MRGRGGLDLWYISSKRVCKRGRSEPSPSAAKWCAWCRAPHSGFELRVARPETVPYRHTFEISPSSQHTKLPIDPPHPGGNLVANLKSISHRCHPILVAFVWELTKETICLPLGCLQGGDRPRPGWRRSPPSRWRRATARSTSRSTGAPALPRRRASPRRPAAGTRRARASGCAPGPRAPSQSLLLFFFFTLVTGPRRSLSRKSVLTWYQRRARASTGPWEAGRAEPCVNIGEKWHGRTHSAVREATVTSSTILRASSSGSACGRTCQPLRARGGPVPIRSSQPHHTGEGAQGGVGGARGMRRGQKAPKCLAHACWRPHARQLTCCVGAEVRPGCSSAGEEGAAHSPPLALESGSGVEGCPCPARPSSSACAATCAGESLSGTAA